jgi:hypothetical protein
MRSHVSLLLGGMILAGGCGGGSRPEFVAAPPPPRPAPPPAPPPPPAPAPKPVPKRKPPPPPKPAPPPDEMRAVGPENRIYYDDATAFRDSVRLTIRDAEAWQDAWTKATQEQAAPPALPEIDFARYMLLLVSAGPMRPGDEIRVDSAGVQSSRPVAVIRTTVECQPFPGSSYPTEIVRVPRSDSAVTFVERSGKTGDC